MYLIIALAIIVFSVMAVTERRILRAATYLLFTLFAAAGIYFMLDYQFLGAVQIAVYAGGIFLLGSAVTDSSCVPVDCDNISTADLVSVSRISSSCDGYITVSGEFLVSLCN